MAYAFRELSKKDVSIDNFLINFEHHIAKLKDHKILLLEPVLAFKTLKSSNLTLENKRLVEVSIRELTLLCPDSFKKYVLMLCQSQWKIKWVLHITKITRRKVGYFIVTVWTNTLIFLVDKVVTIMAGGDVTKTYHAPETKT